MRKSGELIVGICFAAIGILFVIGAVKLKIGVPTQPLPGFFPFIDGTILIALSCLFLLQLWRGREPEGGTSGNLRGPALLIVTLVLYVATLETLGYVLTTAFLSAVVLRIMKTKPRIFIPVSLLLAIVSFFIFDRLLGVTLPRGVLTAFW